jgi:Ser/Thr protein kinase RdoA (MazF antagonist)
MNLIDIKRITANFLSDSDIQVISTESGEYNEAYLLSASSGEYALRTKKKPVHIIPADIQYEVEFMEKLSAAQSFVHIPKTIPTASGDLLFEDADGYYNMQTRVPDGQHVKKWYESHLLSIEDIKELFSTLARLHNVYREFEMTHTKYSPTVFELFAGYRALLDESLPEGPFNTMLAAQRSFLLGKIQTVEDGLRRLHYESCKRYPVHYDMSACNVLWERGKIVSLIDFDWVQESTLEFDFARCVMETAGGYREREVPVMYWMRRNYVLRSNHTMRCRKRLLRI